MSAPAFPTTIFTCSSAPTCLVSPAFQRVPVNAISAIRAHLEPGELVRGDNHLHRMICLGRRFGRSFIGYGGLLHRSAYRPLAALHDGRGAPLTRVLPPRLVQVEPAHGSPSRRHHDPEGKR